MGAQCHDTSLALDLIGFTTCW